MIKSFRDKRTQTLYAGRIEKGIPADIAKAALRKLAIIDAANALGDIRSPPGNMLEALKGDRAGRYAIRVNDQWRICFKWRDGDAYDVEFVDYH